MSEIDVRELVNFHFVLPSTAGELFDVHTHGLGAFDHKEFQILVPGYCRSAAYSILACHADAVINKAERFASGETAEIDGVVCGYEEVAGDLPSHPTRLRIVDIPGGCRCGICGESSKASGHSE